MTSPRTPTSNSHPDGARHISSAAVATRYSRAPGASSVQYTFLPDVRKSRIALRSSFSLPQPTIGLRTVIIIPRMARSALALAMAATT